MKVILMNLRITSLSIITCLTVILTVTDLFAGSSGVKMNISARVLPSLDYAVLPSDDMVEITRSDIQKGYKDLAEGPTVSVTTNDPNGYFISVCGQGGAPFTSLNVSVDGKLHEVPFSGCTEIYMQSRGLSRDIRTLSYRVYFSPEMRQGSYMLPVYVQAVSF